MNLILLALILILEACTPEHERARREGTHSEGVRSDTAELRRFLGLPSDVAVSVLARDDSLVSILSTTGNTSYKIWFIAVSDDTLRPLHKPDSLGPFKPTGARWLDMRGEGKGFVYSLYYPSEAVISTIVYVLTPAGLERSFSDGPSVCSPASVTRDDNGEWIIVTFPDDLTDNNCLNECRDLLQSVAGDPSWPRVLRLTEHRRWSETSDKVFGVYAAAAERFDRMAQLLDDPDEGIDCEDEEWATAAAFRERAQKARSMVR